jgi:hypothetical protein
MLSSPLKKINSKLKTMNDNTEKKIPDFFLKLIEGYSTFNKVYIKFWTTLAIFSIIIIIPTLTEQGKITLPFDIGEFNKEDFYPLGFIIISLLIICFGAAFSQSFRTSKLLYIALEDLKKDFIFNGKIYLQDIVDSLIYPSLSRVAPLAQLSQGKYQFYPQSADIPRYRKVISMIYYIILKTIVITVMHFLPAWALILAFIRGIYYKISNHILNIPVFAYWILGITALIILLQLFLEDLYFMRKVWAHLSKSGKKISASIGVRANESKDEG